MKTIKLLTMILFVMAISFGASANNKTKVTTIKTEKIKVAGNCDMCKTRIESALKVDGIKKATWDSKTQLLTVSFNPSKINDTEIQKKIAAVGHDTQMVKATDKAYGSLPSCCKYKRMK